MLPNPAEIMKDDRRGTRREEHWNADRFSLWPDGGIVVDID